MVEKISSHLENWNWNSWVYWSLGIAQQPATALRHKQDSGARWDPPGGTKRGGRTHQASFNQQGEKTASSYARRHLD